MEPAPELIPFTERWLASCFVDFDHFAEPWSRHSGTRFIGPDPDEWWEGYEKLMAVSKVQLHEMKESGEVIFNPDEIVAWKEGTVGWIAVRGRYSVGQMEPEEARLTMIVHQDGAFWEFVHAHLSFTVTNEESVGLELTTTLDELLELAQDQAPPTAGMSADGSVTIVFTDLEGSTALMESLGEERWLQLLGWHDSIVRQQTAVFGGTVVKGQGDGFMLAFPASGAAAACAMALQRSLGDGWAGVQVRARIGMHSGNAKAEGGDFFGRTVVVSARVSDSAGGGEILLTQSVQEDLNGAFPLEGPRTLSLRGLSGTYTVFALAWN